MLIESDYFLPFLMGSLITLAVILANIRSR